MSTRCGTPFVKVSSKALSSGFADKGVRFAVFAEVFNLFNIANLVAYSGDIDSATFGQPSARFTQVFGSGGPRAFQLGARASF